MNSKLFTRGLLVLFALFFLFGCAAKDPQTMLPSFSPTLFDTDQYTSKVDNFLVIFDASSSMGDCYNEVKKFDIAQILVQRMNMTIPQMDQTAGLRSFGHEDSVSKEPTVLFYGMDKYDTANFGDGLKQITKPGGLSPLWQAFGAAADDFSGLSGVYNAIIIVTDGLDLPGDVIGAAQALKDKYGSSIYFYPIQVGDDPKAKALLDEIAMIGECGVSSNADDLLTTAGIASFVENVFLEKKPPAPPAPERKDTDKDGVYDDEDQCPGTPLGAKVDTVGCWVIDKVLFDFDKDVIKPVTCPQLDEVVTILEKNPDLKVELHGHCDNIGTKEYNMGLSLRRANAVKAYLVDKGISGDRLITEGFGFSAPVAINSTDAGRAQNRRTELHPF